MSTITIRTRATKLIIILPISCLACSSGNNSPGQSALSSASSPLLAPQLSPAAAKGAATSVARAYVVTSPSADCSLHPEGNSDPSQALTVYADDDGVASFLTPAGSAGGTQKLALDCRQPDGTKATYSVDLGVASTFDPARLPPPTKLRPALTGDPLSYSQGDLTRAGYGMRPDPVRSPNLYAAWLDSATRSAKPVVQRPGRYGHPNDIAQSVWGGPALDAANTTYAGVLAYFNAPSASFGTAAASIWGGLGGTGNVFGTDDQTIIQCGIEFDSTNFAVSTFAWEEYFGNNNVACQGGSSCIVPLNYQEGDSIRSASWPCDNQGNVNPNGGFGCFWLVNATSNPQQVLNCVVPNDPTCSSIAQPTGQPYLGLTSEYIIEAHLPTPLSAYDGATMSTAAFDANGSVRDFSSDPSVTFDLVNGSDTLETSSVTGSESVQFTWQAFQ